MMAAAPRTPLETPLASGRVLIEASAGSGKTRAITTLLARLVVEQGLEIDSILVVTFTKSATAELRERVRKTLKAVQDAYGKGGGADDGQARELIEKWESAAALDRAQILSRIDLALLDIDRASILTIHGFCQRALTEFAFETGSPFGFEVSGDGAGLIEGVVRDFWQQRFRGSSRILASFLKKRKFMPEELAHWYRFLRAKRFAEIRGVPESTMDPAQAEKECREKLAEMIPLWREHSEEFSKIVLESNAFNRNQYRVNTIKGHLRTFRIIANGGELPMKMDGLVKLATYFGTENAAKKCKKGHTLPENPLFAAFDELARACNAFLERLEAGLRLVRKELIEHADEEIRRIVRDERRLGYDDLLIEMRHALDREQTGRRLAASIRRRFPVALIDEFQDTDPTQERIFTGIYGGQQEAGALYIVGDPKQSIYEFRGADIFAYLGAQQGADSDLELGSNYRSAPPLVEACNAIFDVDLAFTIPEIGFTPAKPGRDDSARLEIDGKISQPLAFCLLPDQSRVPDATEIAAHRAASEITGLLALSRKGKARIGGTPLRAQDIAVLVATRKQGREIARALRSRGGRCVEINDASIFQTRDAEQVYRLLLALANPGRQDFRRAALAGDQFGLDSERLLALIEDDDYWSKWAERFAAWRDDWQANGVGAMLRKIIGAGGGAGHLLRCVDGPRRLTNFYHLAELLQEAEAENRFSPAGVLAWLKRGISGQGGMEGGDEDTLTLRLDSDEDLVKILTIHKSKGLEFPVVYLPFAWQSRGIGGRADDPVSHHIRQGGQFPAVLDLAPDDACHQMRELEEFGESVRRLYVALTRARERCVVSWTRITSKGDKELPPLGWLLHRNDDHQRMLSAPAENPQEDQPAVPEAVAAVHDDIKGHFRDKERPAFDADVDRLAGKCPRGIEVLNLDNDALANVETTEQEAETELALQRREFNRPVRRIRQMTSFSALAAEQTTPSPGQRFFDTDAVDHDQAVESAAVAEETEAVSQELDAFHFPRGVRVGTCLHRIFEILDEQTGQAGHPERSIDEICQEQLQRAGIDTKWRKVARSMVENTLATTLCEDGHAGFRLGDLKRRLSELEFFFPVKGLHRSGLAALLADAGYPGLLGESPDDKIIDGFLRGFIDLSFEHNGRWYIADYKSNWLGNEADDYQRDKLADAMGDHSYQLQYLIYLLALHRYLRSRLPDYDYDRHIGGAFYLFLRGMSPATGMDRGVWFDRPAKSCIEALDEFMEHAKS